MRGARRAAAVAVALATLGAGCRPPATTEAEGTPSPTGAATSRSGRPIVVRVVAAARDGDGGDAGYLEGIRLAAREVNREGGPGGRRLRVEVLDDGDRDGASMLRSAVRQASAAVLVIGDGPAVTEARPEIESSATPVVLLGDDLYTCRSLFRFAFQTGVPVRWQAAVLARYLVVDRRHRAVALVSEPGPGGDAARQALAAAMAEEGSRLDEVVSFPAARSRLVALGRNDAVVVTGGPRAVARVSAALDGVVRPPQLALSSDALQPATARAGVPPGTVAPYPYTWAGWAEPIRRVAAFRQRFAQAFGRPPEGHQQEGYDAVRLLAEALTRTEGVGGEALVTALEEVRDRTYSSLPIDLGPDDHVLTDQSYVGLFAVAAPGERPPGEAVATVPWRPVMRTFTTDGERIAMVDRDKRTFFPFWKKRRPSPKYWRARYGIVSRRADPLHRGA